MTTSLSAVFRFIGLGASVVAGVAACSSSSNGNGAGGSASLSGTVGGTTFSVASSLAAIGAASTDCSSGFSVDGGAVDAGASCTSSGQAVVILLTNRSDATCAAAQSEIEANKSTAFANFDDLDLAVFTQKGDVAAGTYPVVSGSATVASGAFAQFGTTTSTCASGLIAQGTSGTVTLSQVSSSAVSGTYNVMFGTQGSFSGSFDIPICTLPDGGISSSLGDGGKPACQQ
jgi:hypothetical protein